MALSVLERKEPSLTRKGQLTSPSSNSRLPNRVTGTVQTENILCLTEALVILLERIQAFRYILTHILFKSSYSFSLRGFFPPGPLEWRKHPPTQAIKKIKWLSFRGNGGKTPFLAPCHDALCSASYLSMPIFASWLAEPREISLTSMGMYHKEIYWWYLYVCEYSIRFLFRIWLKKSLQLLSCLHWTNRLSLTTVESSSLKPQDLYISIYSLGFGSRTNGGGQIEGLLGWALGSNWDNCNNSTSTPCQKSFIRRKVGPFFGPHWCTTNSQPT